jgi:rod shape-determining protein MreC
MSGLITTRANRVARRRILAFAVLLALSLVGMTVSNTPFVRELQSGISFAVRPVQATVAGVASTIGSVISSIQEMQTLRQDNRDLRAELDRLRIENVRLQEFQIENDQLLALLGAKNGSGFHTIAATVIARERPEIGRIMTIDRGTSDGLAVGDVVIAAGGAVAGRISDASPTTAHVTLLSDPSSTVTGMIQAGRATGDVVGQLSSPLRMANIDATVRVNIGDQIVTAGIVLGDGVRSPYPKGLPIGQVVDVQRDANAVVQVAFLTPTADLDKLEYVLVITDYQGGLPPPPGSSPTPSPAGGP